MNEAFFWGMVRHRMPPGWFARRIEDGSGNLGTFDTYLAHPSHGSAWLELKVAGPDAKPELRKGQPAFGHGLYEACVPAGYLVGSPNGKVRLLDPLTLGDDWREHLIAEWAHLDMSSVLYNLYDWRRRAVLRRVG